MSNLQNLFNPTGAQPTQSAKNAELYKVSYKEGANGVYKSIVRFVPFPQNTAKCVMSKSITWLKNPTTGQGMYVDDPRSIGQYSPATELFFQLWNTQNPQWQAFAKQHLSTKEQHASLVQIIQDDQHPELVGQIKIFTYGKTIFDKLYAEEHPVAGVGINPFHPIYGRYFSIVCESKSNFNNFDKSMFFDNKDKTGANLPCGLWYTNPQTNQVEYVTENSDQQAVFDYLNANCPDLSKYDYQPWTADQEKYVTDVLAVIRQYFQSGTPQTTQQTAYQSNMQTLNSPVGIQMNPNPVFPGATMPMQQTPAMSNPTPVQPAMPTPGVQMGGMSMGAAVPPTPQMGAPINNGAATVTGIDLPKVAPAGAPQMGPAPTMSATPTIGDISSIISDL